MSDQSLFTKETIPATPETTQTTPSDNLFSDQLAQIKNEEGVQKYGDVNKALEALQHSQTYIPEIKGELDATKAALAAATAELEKRESVEDVVKRLTEKQEPAPVATPQPTGLAQDDVVGLIKQTLEQTSEESRLRANMASVQAKLQDKYKDKAKEVLEAKAVQLNTTLEKLGEIAATNPDMFLEFFPDVQGSATPVTGSSRTVSSPAGAFVAEKPARSVLVGANSKQKVDHLLDIRREVYEKFNVS